MHRPLAVLAVLGTAAHHGYELANGVGLVFQPQLGLVGSSALWGSQLPVWAVLAARGSRRWDPLLAALAGVGLAGVATHFLVWPWRWGRVGLPVLAEAEGLAPGQLPTYNAILWAWAGASALSLAVETKGKDRRWALAGLATLPVLSASARHHFSWVRDQATTNPAWWNRGLRDGGAVGSEAS